MKTIGLIGGMSWESTTTYYRLINQEIKRRLGGLHSAKLIVYSVDFEEVAQLQRIEDWPAAGEALARIARSLELAGAECVLICANTMHIVAAAVEAAVRIPLLHIADPTASAIKQAGCSTVGLLGTRFVMEKPFYGDRLRDLHGLHVVVPSPDDREIVHRIVYDELCQGQVRAESRAQFRRIMADLQARDATAIIIGCTEFSLLVGPEDSVLPLFDTAGLHARAAAEWALSDV